MREMTTETFSGRSVLVTGHTGFKGSWLTMWLHHLGALVSGYALDPPTTPSLYELAGVAGLVVRDGRGDVRDLMSLRNAVEEAHPDVIFHMAAQPLVRNAFANPAVTFDVNVMGTVNMLEAVRLAHRPCVVIVVTSDKCYENSGCPTGFVEADRLGGTEAYGASKAAAELVVAAYRSTYFPPERYQDHGVSVASVRAGNVIGGGDWSADRIIPDVVRALAAHQPVKLRFPAAIRPWQHVAVPLSGYLHLAAALIDGKISQQTGCGAWNFGPGPDSEVPVSRLVDDAIRLWGSGGCESVSDPLQSHEATALRLDVSKASRILGWQPAWAYEMSIERTIAWYRSWAITPDFDAALACLDCIRDYESASGRIPPAVDASFAAHG